METNTIGLDDVHRMLGERDIALFQASRRIDQLLAEVQRLRADLQEATKDKLPQG